jgi:hypothetical protein
MSEQSIHLPKTDISRRTLFKAACGAVGAITLVGLTSSEVMAAKLTQKAANYQPTPKGSAKCSGCKNFQAPSACKQVEGVIAANGWCQLFIVS